MKNNEYVVLDIETTGLSREKHKITEIAAVKIKGEKEVEEFQTLVNPETRIPGFITRLTGIDNELVKDSPTISEVMPQFHSFIGDATIIAHNASFDYGFLNHNSEKYLGHSIDNDKICTKKLANRLLPREMSKRLGVLCEHFDITNTQAHRAMADTKATIELFSNFRDMLEERGITEHEELVRFEKMPNGKYKPKK